MKARAIKAFLHSETGRIYLRGEWFEGDEETVADLARRGFLDAECGPVPASASGPGKRVELAAMTVRELTAMCAELGIDAPKKKADIIKAIEAAQAGE